MQLPCIFRAKGFQGLARLLAFTFIFSLGLPAVAEAAMPGGLSGIVDAVKSAGSTSGSTSGSSGGPGAAQEAPKAQASASIIAVSTKEMKYSDAVAFCKQKGGRLPLINNSDTWDLKQPIKGTPVDGIAGGMDAPWPAELDRDGRYWTGTNVANDPEFLWIITRTGNEVSYGKWINKGQRRAYCVR